MRKTHPTDYFFAAAMQVYADEIRPALLDSKEQNTGLYAITWKVPTHGDKVLAITSQLPASLQLIGSSFAGSRYFCESLFWASQPKQAAKT